MEGPLRSRTLIELKQIQNLPGWFPKKKQLDIRRLRYHSQGIDLVQKDDKIYDKIYDKKKNMTRFRGGKSYSDMCGDCKVTKTTRFLLCTRISVG